ncbi:MAG: hypothetical protein H6688_01015 [Erysipelotrichaceae bacterium]|nr:hypothetical protein [Erysipelotrichaceae bacterium]
MMKKATIEHLHINYYSYKNIEKVGLEHAVEEVIDYLREKLTDFICHSIWMR